MRKRKVMAVLGWAVKIVFLFTFSPAQAGTTLIISVEDPTSFGSGQFRFGSDTVTGNISYAAHFSNSAIKSSLRVGERLITPDSFAFGEKEYYNYLELTKRDHTLIFTHKQKMGRSDEYSNYTYIHTQVLSYEILDDGTCVQHIHTSSLTEPKDLKDYDYDWAPPGPVKCTWVPEKSPDVSSSNSSRLMRACEGGVTVSERRTSSNFCITVNNQCGFMITARVSRTDGKKGGSFAVGSSPATECSDNLSWKYVYEGYLDRRTD